MKNPCRGCGIRHEACHDECEAYKAWKAEREAQKQFERDEYPRHFFIKSDMHRKTRF